MNRSYSVALLILAFAIAVKSQEGQLDRDLIQSISPFSPSATVVLKPNSECVGLRSIPEAARTPRVKEAIRACANRRPDKLEIGTVNGVAYQFYYSDGSGSFASAPKSVTTSSEKEQRGSYAEDYRRAWRVACKKDRITDEKACYIDRGDFQTVPYVLRVWVDSRGRSEIYIGANHYPGSQVIIRIDKTAPLAVNSRILNGSFGYWASPAIINRIATAKTVTTRYQEWPHKDYVDETWNTYGFKEALAYIRWAVARIK